ncbi:response regulator [Halobacterium wangiae]|uniref:response regulator n=1 Tax=Halobacterium wangiae TaxID=2902623 RepID=UPI001E5A5313|nr:response regulator [Halobacterium wangiae]
MTEQTRGEEPANVLLVEDNPGDVRLAREAFETGSDADTLHVVNDGDEALDFLFRRGDYEDAPRVDVVLLDLNLPRKNGDEVLAEVRADPELARIPVVVFTSSESETDVVRSYDLQANAYLTKPVDPGAFIEAVQAFKRFWLSAVRLPDRD